MINRNKKDLWETEQMAPWGLGFVPLPNLQMKLLDNESQQILSRVGPAHHFDGLGLRTGCGP